MKTIRFAAFILVVGTLMAASGCRDAPPEPNIGPEERPDGPAMTDTKPAVNTMADSPDGGNVTVADVTGDTNAYIGITVTVRGWVEETYGGNSFKLDEDSVFTGGIDNDLLVVGAKGVVPSGMKYGSDDARVQVTGTVKRVVIADIERDYGFEFDSEVEAEFRDKAVLVATAVKVIERDDY